MRTSFIAVGATLLYLSIVSISIVQYNKIQQHAKAIQAKNTEIAELNSILDVESEKVSELNTLNQVYADSIVVLNTKIFELEEELRIKNKSIKYLKGKLKRREIAYQELKDKIAILYKKEQLDQKTINRLEKEKEALRQEMSNIQSNKQDIFASKATTQKEITTFKENISQMHSLSEVAQNTRVDFHEITGKKFKNGRKINRMKKNMNGWQYTDFKFTLSNPNHLALLNQKFVLKIHDLENDISLAYLEQNPKFTNNNERGLPFQFDGNTIELTFCNMQKKLSENFEVRLFLLHNGEEIAIDNASLPLVKDGKFIKL